MQFHLSTPLNGPERRLRLLALFATLVITGAWYIETFVPEFVTVEAALTTSSVVTDEPSGLATPTKVSSCNPDRASAVPVIVAGVFRCRLTELGWPAPVVEKVVAEALTVSWCESRWDPDVVVADGKYVNRRHPRTGTILTARGTWQFIRATGNHWIDGGYAASTDPVASTHAAVSLYLHDLDRTGQGWNAWACAGANDGFAAHSVLPGYPGGPSALPEWASRY